MCEIIKTKKAWECYKWYQQCRAVHPYVRYENAALWVDVVKAPPVCVTQQANAVTQVFEQVERWAKIPTPSDSWQQYVDSIAHRTSNARALEQMRSIDVAMNTFCHGDLTLENVLVSDRVYYIDPNPGRYNSHWLDIGKLEFSLEYHDRFGSYWLEATIRERLLEHLEAYDADIRHAVLISHIIRLEGYQPQDKVEEWLACVCS